MEPAGSPGALVRKGPETSPSYNRATAHATAGAVPLASILYGTEVAQPGQVFEHRLQQGLGDRQALCQLVVAVDPAFSNYRQKFFNHEPSAPTR